MPAQTFPYISGDENLGQPLTATWPCAGGDVLIKTYPMKNETPAQTAARFLAQIDLAQSEHPYTP